MSTSWIRCLSDVGRRGDINGVSVVAFPHAGGSANYFQPWSRIMPVGTELCAVQYPGRQDRVNEPCAATMADMVDPVVGELLRRPSFTGLVLLGHSLGAVIAFEVARALEKQRGPVRRLIVTGRRPPHLEPRRLVHEGSDEAILADAVRLGGLDASVLENPSVRELLLVPMRADYTLADTYVPTDDSPLLTPITALNGDRDPEVSPEEAAEWFRYTRGDFRSEVVAGGHFFLRDAPLVALRPVIQDVSRGGPMSLPFPSTP